MCGIIAVLRRRSQRPVPEAKDVEQKLDAALQSLPGDAAPPQPAQLRAAAEQIEAINAALWGPPGITCLLRTPKLAARLRDDLAGVQRRIDALEAALDAGQAALSPAELERTNAALVRLKDAVWAVARDRLPTAEAVRDLARGDLGVAAIEAFASVQSALSALDRLEVRGRDSAGVHVLVTGHGLDLRDEEIRAQLVARDDPLFTSCAARTPNGHLGFVYKAAAEIGKLGDNVKALRQAIVADDLLHRALAADTAEAVVLGHTRWASIGIISQPNAHPLNHEEQGRRDGPYVLAALNGDVDNYAELKAREGLCVPAEITTDAKVIPVLTSRAMASGKSFEEAFRTTVASFVGSVAIAAATAERADQLAIALHGSGQALYVGFRDDAFLVASEPYGLVEETNRYLRLDGETPGNPKNPLQSRGQLVFLDRRHAGTLQGVLRMAYDGTALPVREAELQRAEITTRDIDRNTFPHFFLKEISQAPSSFRKTLRGKIVERDGTLHAELGNDTLPPALRQRLRNGEIRRVFVVGQGTAAVAGQGVAAMMAKALAGTGLTVRAMPATELSGFHMREDMSDTLVVAISQSGTTTDTNRTVDLVRGRGAAVIAIVNRRSSDLTDKADGVLYTADGRDVEMSVASTKAFYGQIAAGTVLAFALAEEIGECDRKLRHEMLTALRAMPDAMQRVLSLREQIGVAAKAHAPRRRYWAVVGNGHNHIAAQEVRIKLSELCYKSIACDTTEDKKHIDLSAEPLILVCCAGLSGSNADDVAKEVEIYRAHKAAPIVIASEGETRFSAAFAVIPVPSVHPALDFVLTTVAGHLFGYESARAIDGLANPLRECRAVIERLASTSVDGSDLLGRMAEEMRPAAMAFLPALRSGAYDGCVTASVASRIGSLLRYALGIAPLESYSVEHGVIGTPSVVVEELTEALTRGIEELTRPVDAIKHQAKTVTVGISRADEGLLTVPLVKEVLAAGTPRDRLGYRELRTLAALQPAVARTVGFTRYRIDGTPDDGATIHVVQKGGVAEKLASRTDKDPALRGTKRQVTVEQRVLVARGASDQRRVIIAPEVQNGRVSGLILLHVEFHEHVPAAAMRDVLRGYRNRYEFLRDAVMETEQDFREDLLEKLPAAELLTAPILQLAEHWRKR
jgi:glucosamine--fructose-6-phosphate aminotransferase (isomerizing)